MTSPRRDSRVLRNGGRFSDTHFNGVFNGAPHRLHSLQEFEPWTVPKDEETTNSSETKGNEEINRFIAKTLKRAYDAMPCIGECLQMVSDHPNALVLFNEAKAYIPCHSRGVSLMWTKPPNRRQSAPDGAYRQPRHGGSPSPPLR